MTETYLGMPPPRMVAWLRSHSKKQDAGDEILWVKYIDEEFGDYMDGQMYMKNKDGDFETVYLDPGGKGVVAAKALFGEVPRRFVEGDGEWYSEYTFFGETMGERLYVVEQVSPDCQTLSFEEGGTAQCMLVRTTASDFYNAIASGTNRLPSGTDLHYDEWDDAWVVFEMLDHEYAVIECDDPEFKPILCRRNPDFCLKQYDGMETLPEKYSVLQPVYVDGDGTVREILNAAADARGCSVYLTNTVRDYTDDFYPQFTGENGKIAIRYGEDPAYSVRVTGYDSLDDIPDSLKTSLETDLQQKWDLHAIMPDDGENWPFVGVRKVLPGDADVSNTVYAWNDYTKRFERADIDGEGNVLAVHPGDFFAYIARDDGDQSTDVTQYWWIAHHENNDEIGMSRCEIVEKIGNIYIIMLWPWDPAHKNLSEYIELFDREGAVRFAAGQL